MIGQLAGYPLLEALIERRSRRFGSGMRLNGGPLAYRSVRTPQPLSLEEEAVLAFAGCCEVVSAADTPRTQLTLVGADG